MKDERKTNTTCFNVHPSSFRLHPFNLEAMKGVEPLSTGLQDRRSVIQLSYIAIKIGGAKRNRTPTSCLQGRHHAVRS
jgi:hypothetical protein